MADETEAVEETGQPQEVPPNVKIFYTSSEETESPPAGPDVTIGVEPERPTLPVKIVTFRAPNIDHVVLMSSLLEGAKDDQRAAALMINWFFSMLSKPDQRYFEARLFDPNDKFSLHKISEVIDHLMEQWSGGRPTQRSSGSSRSPKTGGKKSTAKRHGKGGHRSGSAHSGSGARSSTGGTRATSAPKAAPSSAP